MQIRSYKQGDEIKIWELDRKLEIHPWNRRDLNNWYWKYTEQNPAGNSIIWVIEKDEKIIAHFAVVPYRLKVFKEEYIASHSIAAMVDRDYQKLGLMKFLGDKLFVDVAQNHIPFTYGFPNSRFYEFHKKIMDYVDLIKFPTWRIVKLPKCRKILGFRYVSQFDISVDLLWNSCKDGYKIAVNRDKNYLNWRYLKRPDSRYYPFGIFSQTELKGYVVLKLYREDKIVRGHIIDIFAEKSDTKIFEKLIMGSLAFFSEKKVDEVTLWVWGNNEIEKILEEKNFNKELTETPLLIRINKEFPHRAEVLDNKNWYFTMGDSTEIF